MFGQFEDNNIVAMCLLYEKFGLLGDNSDNMLQINDMKYTNTRRGERKVTSGINDALHAKN